MPREFEAGYETWLGGSAEYSGNANVWAGMAWDPELDYVYAPTSTPTNDYYGGARPGDNLFAESLVCLEARTGRRVWHFQAVHHGLWDYDFASTPVLADITVDGRPIKAVILVSKQAFAYVFDRATGEPVWPIEERPVPASAVPGEWTAPTQPFPTRPAPFDLQGATAENLIDFTPELRRRALEQLQNFDHGPLYTPPTLRGTLILPGIVGGANWPGGSYDPETGLFYVASRMNPSLIKLVPMDPERSNLRYPVAARRTVRKKTESFVGMATSCHIRRHLTETSWRTIGTGMTICGPDDNFCRATGRALAIRRAYAHVLPADKPLAALAISAYFNRKQPYQNEHLTPSERLQAAVMPK